MPLNELDPLDTEQKSKSKPIQYFPSGDEIEIFAVAAQQKLAVMLKGPTGCGKTRFVEYMAQQLKRPLVTVPCHEDLTAADLVGRYLLKGGETIWEDGPLTRAVKMGAICYLDEIVEARSDTTVVLHPLTDHRRELHIDRLNQTWQMPDDFMVVISYNPGYQSVLKDLKESTRQRMVGIDFDYLDAEQEAKVIAAESGLGKEVCEDLVKLASAIRRLQTGMLSEVASTRTIVATAHLICGGVAPRRAAAACIASALSDDAEIIDGLNEMIRNYLRERY
jgi:nitric oxide reductase NorQ protein